MHTAQTLLAATRNFYVVNLSPPSPLELWAMRARAKRDVGVR